MGRSVNNPPPHAACYRASQAAKKGTGGGAGGDRDWRLRNDNLGGWRDGPKTLPQRPPTPPVEPWDCDIEGEIPPTAPTSTPTEEDTEEEEENWDTASEDELSWDKFATPPTNYSNLSLIHI